MPSRARVGLFIGFLAGDYYRSIWQGAIDAALDGGADLVTFVGADLDSPHGYEAQRTAVYDLAGPDCIDALVLCSGTLGRYTGPDGVAALARRVSRGRDIPTVSLEAPIPDVPTIRVDDLGGMRELIAHLVDVHGLRRIAFVQGPEGNADAEYRYQAYRAVLQEHRIPFDAELVTRGYFDASR